MSLLKNLESFIWRLAKMLEGKIKKSLPRHEVKKDVLKNLERSFISRLVKIQEDNNFFAKRRYSYIYTYFPSVICENGRPPLLRFKAITYSVLSKLAKDNDDEIGMNMDFILIFRDRMHCEYITSMKEFDALTHKHFERAYDENERFYLNIGCAYSIFDADDYPGVWEDDELYSDLDFHGNTVGRNHVFDDLRKRLDVGPFYYEDKFGSSIVIRKNGILTFRAEECVICRDSEPRILFCNCGHILVCEECDNTGNFKSCPLCKLECSIKRKL